MVIMAESGVHDTAIPGYEAHRHDWVCAGCLEMADQKVEKANMQGATHSGSTDTQNNSDAHIVLSSMPAARYY